MAARPFPHRHASGAIRRLASGRWQTRYTGPDGAMRSLGLSDRRGSRPGARAETSRIARGSGTTPAAMSSVSATGFRDSIASRSVLADSTRALCLRLLERWIDAPLPLPPRANGPEPVVYLGAQTLASVPPADVRE